MDSWFAANLLPPYCSQRNLKPLPHQDDDDENNKDDDDNNYQKIP